MAVLQFHIDAILKSLIATGQILKETYGAKYGPSIPCKSSPQPWRLAAQRNQLNPEMVDFTGPDTILGEEIVDMLMSGKNTVSDSTGNVKLLVGASS